MTEFKKLKETLASQLEPSLIQLFPSQESDNATSSIEERYKLLTSTQAIAADAAVRFIKLVSRARETNPDKQIFNEKTSKAIIDEFLVFVSFYGKFYEMELPATEPQVSEDDNPHPPPTRNQKPTSPPITVDAIVEQRMIFVDPLTIPSLTWDFGPLMTTLQVQFAQNLIAKAQAAEAHQSLLNSLQSIEEAEGDGRQLVAMTEKACYHTELVPLAQASKKAAREAQAAREKRLFEEEIFRRKEEMATFKEKLAVPDALTKAMAAVQLLLTPIAFKVFKRAVRDLSDEVINHPENENIRMMRSDHYRTVASFGHPGIVECSEVYSHAEVVLGCIGYIIAYTKQPPHSAKTPQHVSEMGGSLELPLGPGLRPIHYNKVGYEEYSERLLVFQEPDPSEDPQAWCDWHEQASNTATALHTAFSE